LLSIAILFSLASILFDINIDPSAFFWTVLSFFKNTLSLNGSSSCLLPSGGSHQEDHGSVPAKENSLKIPNTKRAGGVAQVVECPPSKYVSYLQNKILFFLFLSCC
jgi:hypothetical protein